MYANERLLGFHTGNQESVTLSLPQKYSRITEVFTGEVLPDTDVIHFTTNGPDTRLYRLEK